MITGPQGTEGLPYVDLQEISDPGAPSSNFNRFYSLNVSGSSRVRLRKPGSGNGTLLAEVFYVSPGDGSSQIDFALSGVGLRCANGKAISFSNNNNFATASNDTYLTRGGVGILRVGSSNGGSDGIVAARPRLPSYTVASLPSGTAGDLIFVSDEVGGPTTAFYDGTNWRRVQDRAIVS